MIWHYKHYFNCDSKNVIYVLMCTTCEWFYLGQTATLKQIIRKQIKFCHKDCWRIKKPFFRIYPFLYENKKGLSEFKQKRFIMRWKPQSSTYQQIVKVKLKNYFRCSQ